MKRFLLLFSVIALTLCAGAPVWAIVQGTPHDVNVMKDTTGLEICAMCHTPHTQATTLQYPLWNRSQTAQSYQMYASKTFDMTDGATAPQGVSALCMVCHNGVLSSLVNYPGPGSTANTMYNFINNDPALQSGQSNLGLDLRGEHPISFQYNATTILEDSDNNGFPAPEAYGTGANRKAVKGTGSGIYYPLYGDNNDQFECATCHAVHHTVEYPGPAMENGKSAGTQVYFLRNDNTGSRMCTDCHTKR